MVAKIITGKSVQGAIMYNEHKVGQGKASLLLASGFAADVSRLDLPAKFLRFEELTGLNPKIKTNTLHISLNFDPAEKLDDAQLAGIAMRYMELLGFRYQPFLVYRHWDAAHDHLHLVTTNVQDDGEAIQLHNLGKNISEPARKQIEDEFGLVKAESKKRASGPDFQPADLSVAQYGKAPTKEALRNVIGAIVRSYLFTSLSEYQAVLARFNVGCDRGAPGSAQYEHRGLTYSLVNENGEKLGVPIKASAFYSKPTLNNLEQLFGKNAEKRTAFRAPLREKIEGIFDRYERVRMTTFLRELENAGVTARFVRNEKGRYFGVTFIDHRSKAVFKGSTLGKAYSAASLVQRFSQDDRRKTYLSRDNTGTSYLGRSMESGLQHDSGTAAVQSPDTNYLGLLLDKSPLDYGPTTLPRRRRKRRKRGLSR